MTINDEEFDRLLQRRELTPPEGFSTTLMEKIVVEVSSVKQPHSIQSVLQWLLLGVGGVIGMMQSLYFLFGIWIATAAI